MFKLRNDGNIERLADGAIIPADPKNADYQAFQVWVDGGNEPEAATPPPAASKAPVTLEALHAALIEKGVVTQADVDAKVEIIEAAEVKP